MALRYWVGGNDTWNSTAGLKWSLTSGGPGGQAVPGIDDDVILDAASGVVTITTAANVTARSFVATTFTGTFIGSGNFQLLGSNTGVQGSGKSIELGSGMTYSYTGIWTIGANRGSGSINFNGKSHNGGNININGSSPNAATAQYSLVNDITNTVGAMTVGGCTFNTNNYNITVVRFDIVGGANTKVLNFGTSIITLTQTLSACWNNANTGSLTINGTYTIRTTGIVTSSITFIGGGATYYHLELLRGNGTGTVIIQGSNNFFYFTDVAGTAPHDITFTAGTQNTFQNFNVRGASTSARVRLLVTGTGATPLLDKGGDSGYVYCDFLNLGSNTTSVTPANTWYAGYNSIGTSTGWVLRNPPGMLLMGVGG